MQGNFWRTILKNSAASILIEYGVFLAISMAINDKNEYYYAFLMMLGFWGIQIVAWIKNHIVSAILYYISGKRQMIDMFESDLRRNKMPIYDDQEYFNTEGYIARIVSDKRSQKDQLVFAGSVAGALHAIVGTARLRLINTFDAALKQYSANSGNLEELKRSSDDPAQTAENKAKNRYETSAVEDLSDEETKRQSGLLVALKAKAWSASGVMWDYHAQKMSKEVAEDEWGKYLKYKNSVYRHLENLTDEFFRNTAMRFIIEMLVVAQEVDEAQSLIAQMSIDYIRYEAEDAIVAGPRRVYEKQRKEQ